MVTRPTLPQRIAIIEQISYLRGTLVELQRTESGLSAYPSGHATFRTASFRTIAKGLSKEPRQISVGITSEFNGRTIDGITGQKRREWTKDSTLWWVFIV